MEAGHAKLSSVGLGTNFNLSVENYGKIVLRNNTRLNMAREGRETH